MIIQVTQMSFNMDKFITQKAYSASLNNFHTRNNVCSISASKRSLPSHTGGPYQVKATTNLDNFDVTALRGYMQRSVIHNVRNRQQTRCLRVFQYDLLMKWENLCSLVIYDVKNCYHPDRHVYEANR